MKFKSSITLLLVLITLGCQKNSQEKQFVAEKSSVEAIQKIAVQKSSTYIENVTKKVEKLISENSFTSFEMLQTQKLDRIEENSEVLVDITTSAVKNGNQIYHHLKESTFFIGSSYLCDRCPNIHLNNASGFIIHEDGVLVTNYHVIEVKEGLDISGVFAADYEGNVYPVSKILAASQSNDLAILQLDTKGIKLKALPVAEEELVGETIFMMGHPFSNTFLMTKGIIGRKFISERDEEVKITVTTEFGPGASGGPIVNENGQIVGVVSAIEMKYANNSKQQGGVQMILKEAIPVSVLNNYLKRS